MPEWQTHPRSLQATHPVHPKKLMDPRYFEDYAVGEVIDAAGFTLTEAEIIHFALTYDPQSFHTNVAAARESIYGGLIASGWQVAVLAFKMLVHAGLVGSASQGSPGLENLRWIKPVRPGDTLYPHSKVVEMRPSASKPDRGLVRVESWVENQNSETVCSFVSTQIVRRRKA